MLNILKTNPMKKIHPLKSSTGIKTLIHLTCNRNNKIQNKFRRLYTIVMMLALLATQSLTAQYTKLYEFRAEDNNNISHPNYSQLVSYGSALYGMTGQGGSYDVGVIFKINTDGTGYQKLLDFNNTNGASPQGSLTLVGDSLYGMTYNGGAGTGVIFKININGTGYQILYNFNYSNGANPCGSLTLVGDSLYGMTTSGGTNGNGVIFKINRNGTGYQKMLDFDGTNKGSYPQGSFTLSDDSLYGMTYSGGANSYGVIFKINKSGSGYQKLLDFDGTSKGSYPYGSLTLAGDSLYGMTAQGGSNSYGVIFKINKSGSGYQKMLDFKGATGYDPYGSFTLSGDSLYGMTTYGGTNGRGVIFKINKSGSGYQKLLDFDGTNKGSNPSGSFTQVGNSLYGMTSSGGVSNKGVVFKINKDGTGFSKLKDCTIAPQGSYPNDVVTDGTYLYATTRNGGANGLGGIFKTNMDGTGYQQLLEFNGTNGATPCSSLTLVGDSLYGTTYYGGANSCGVIFKINKSGSGYQKMLDFNYINGGYPYGSLTLVGDSLYGMTQNGGANYDGVIFKINRNGSGFQKLLDFDGANKGSYPYGSLTLLGDSLYGMNYNGGANGYGVIFKISRNGSGFQKLFDFNYPGTGYGSYGSLTLSGDSLYGMAPYGGTNYDGVIFKINKNGNGYQKLRDFSWSDGGSPRGSLTLLGDFLYGMTYAGGNNYGTMFKISTKSGAYQKLFDFDYANNGGYPQGSLTLLGNSFYGTCQQGGTDGMGVIFKYIPLASIQATNVQFTNVLATQMDISFTKGDGNYRAVFMRQGNTGTPTLANGTAYTANSVFGSGTQAGTGWYCIANGLLNSGNIAVTGLTAFTQYRVMVVEYNGTSSAEQYLTSTASGNPANQTTIAVQNQTITFAALATKICGDADFNPGATASSGLTVTYTSSNTVVATIVNGNIHIVGIGTTNITASQAGNSNYNAATDVVQPLTVNIGNQTITFPSLSTKSPGDADFNPGATASSGLPVTYTSSNTAVATIVSGNIHIVSMGISNITASQAGNSNFNAATDVVQVLSVKTAQTITFNALPSKTYGDADFNPGATASSGLTVTYSSSNTEVATIVSGNIHIVGAGTANITASQAGNSNYNAAANVVQALTVNKAVLTATADNKTRKKGEANPTFTITYSGWVGTDNADVLDTKPITECSATAASPVGDYDITVKGGSDNNYDFTYVSGKLTIQPGTTVNELGEQGIEIYPIPASDKLYIKIPGNKTAIVQIVNMSGQVVVNKELTNEIETLDVSKLTKGIYILKVIIRDALVIEKIDVQ